MFPTIIKKGKRVPGSFCSTAAPQYWRIRVSAQLEGPLDCVVLRYSLGPPFLPTGQPGPSCSARDLPERQQNILCWSRRPGPWPGAEVVTAKLEITMSRARSPSLGQPAIGSDGPGAHSIAAGNPLRLARAYAAPRRAGAQPQLSPGPGPASEDLRSADRRTAASPSTASSVSRRLGLRVGPR